MFTYMNDSVKSAARVLDLLELFTLVPESMGVSDVAKRLGIPKSSAQSLLLTLVGRGYLNRETDSYSLPQELRGGWVGGIRSRLIGIAKPVMQKMAKESGESAFIGVLTGGGKIQYLDKAVSSREVRYDASLSHLRPVYCTSIGLIILAQMSEPEITRYLKPDLLVTVTPKTETDPNKIRLLLRQALKDGFVEVRDTNVEGASGVSAPIFGPSGNVIAGLNLGAPTPRYKKNRLELITLVCSGAASISASLNSSQTSNT